MVHAMLHAYQLHESVAVRCAEQRVCVFVALTLFLMLFAPPFSIRCAISRAPHQQPNDLLQFLPLPISFIIYDDQRRLSRLSSSLANALHGAHTHTIIVSKKTSITSVARSRRHSVTKCVRRCSSVSLISAGFFYRVHYSSAQCTTAYYTCCFVCVVRSVGRCDLWYIDTAVTSS